MKNEDIEALKARIAEMRAKGEQEVEDLRVALLGKKGEVTKMFDEFRTVAPEQKKEFGQKLNQLKQMAQAKIDELKAEVLEEESEAPATSSVDMTRPGDNFELGSRHPISIAREEILGMLACSAGLLDENRPATMEELIDTFDWEKVRTEDMRLPLSF